MGLTSLKSFMVYRMTRKSAELRPRRLSENLLSFVHNILIIFSMTLLGFLKFLSLLKILPRNLLSFMATFRISLLKPKLLLLMITRFNVRISTVFSAISGTVLFLVFQVLSARLWDLWLPLSLRLLY